MLEINKLSVRYLKGEPVLEDLSSALEIGKIHGLVGLNGSGKTTLLNCLSGMLPFQEGTINWMGKRLTKREVVLLETYNFFYKQVTGKEYLQLFATLNPMFDLFSWNALFALPLEHFIEDYSTGMKKKLAFMSVLSFDKPLLILDEPFNGIDLETVQLVKVIINKLKAAGKTIIITSHILESLLNFCDTISYLNNRSIQRTFLPPEFAQIEETLFDVTNKRNDNLIDKLIKPKNDDEQDLS
ncbi:ATP-binding cassette domain-containing protein [Olivibacter sp. SDN3]|uniref:ATP-binding cassette domain-containing protein n=1 Tax=Olivibacter sp. SDN3 TaxID=2764720 RepID=UPI00165185B6|nr:ATP-binding cassette domain-containing protein [Olivibacter sp. SDN3]QNL50971.1 ATP-binding cassette domain-containing protein [Olivibacter sp. SDN3]